MLTTVLMPCISLGVMIALHFHREYKADKRNQAKDNNKKAD